MKPAIQQGTGTRLAESEPPSLGRVATRGMAWLTLQNAGNRVASLLAQILLARLLVPEDYGLIALASGSIALVAAFADFGIDQILVQRQRAMRLWRGVAFWLSVVLAMTLGLASALSSVVFARIYDESALVGLICVLSLALPIGSLSTLPVADIKMRLRFDLLAAIGLAEVLAVQALTVTFAALGFGAYSFALPIPIVVAAKVLALWRIAPQPIGRGPMLGRWKHILARGLSVVGSRIVSTLTSQTDLIVLGLVSTADRTGLYFFAYRAAVQPLRMLAGSISGVMQPALSRLKHDPEGQTRAALHASRVLAYLIMPTCFLQIAVAEPMLHLVFGDRWAGAVPVVQLLSLGLAFDAVSWVAGSVILSQGRFHFAFVLSLVFSSMLVTTVLGLNMLFQWTQAEIGVAASLMLFYAFVQPFYSYAVFRKRGVTLREIAILHYAPAALSAAAFGIAYVAAERLVPAAGSFWRILVVASLGGVLYLAGAHLVAPAIVRDVRERLAGLSASRPAFTRRRFRIGKHSL